MAQSEIQAIGITAGIQEQARPDLVERRLRRISGWFMLFFLFQGQLGATWDREWHAYVGRDWFWTPPHTLIYSCVTGAGLIALGVVLAETLRYRRGAIGVNDQSTVRIFRIFHAPLGFIVTGFGAFTALVAAPLDNYWHQLYGIDIALWAPFHMMGVTGAFIGSLGMVYVFASEAVIDRKAGIVSRRFLGLTLLEWSVLMTTAGLLNLTLTGFLQFPIVELGLLRIPTYLLPATACGALCLISAVRFTSRPGAATCMVLLLLVYTVVTELFVPWAIRTAVEQQSLHYRIAGNIPYYRWSDALIPLYLIISAFIVDGIGFWQVRHGKKLSDKIRYAWLLSFIITLPEMVLASCIVMWTPNLVQAFLNEPGVIIPLDLKLSATLLAVPVILIAGLLGTIWGIDFGDIWRLSTR